MMSVGGSLASYHVKQEDDFVFRAVLRTTQGERDDIPPEISLRKMGEDWLAEPAHGEVVPGLIQAIESNHR